MRSAHLKFAVSTSSVSINGKEIVSNAESPTPHLQVSVAVPVTVRVLLLVACAVAVTVTDPLVAPMQVAVPLLPELLLIETLIGSDTVQVWPEQFTQAVLPHPFGTTAFAKN